MTAQPIVPQAECPDERAIAQLAHGLLPEDEAERLIAHIDGCPACNAASDAHLRRGDPLVQQLREAHDSNDAPDPACAAVLSRLRNVDLEQRCGGEPLAEMPDLKHVRDYEITEKLGEGGMGVVYKAVHTRLDKTVAIKVLSPRYWSRPSRVERFTREMKAVGKLEHPNIVRATDAGDENGVQFLVMEFVDGEDLSKRVKRLGPLPVADACEIIRQAATGFQFAHGQGLIHRDIKPSNLMLVPPTHEHDGEQKSTASTHAVGTVKILDLGLARLLHDHSDESAPDPGSVTTSTVASELTRDGFILGTADYMAPEQARDGTSADARSDIYALGCTFYFLLTGGPPMRGELAATARQLRRLDEFRDDVPPEVEAILRKMCAKDPSQRYASMAQVARDLEPLAVGQASQPASVGRTLHTVWHAQSLRWAWRRRTQTHALPTASGRATLAGFVGRVVMIAAALGLAGGAIWFGVTTLRVKVGDGTLQIQYDGDDFDATVAGETITLENLKSGKRKSITITAQKTAEPMESGRYRIVLRDDSGLEVAGGSSVIVKSGKTQTVLVRYVSREDAAALAKAPVDYAAQRKAAERVQSLQGEMMLKLADGQRLNVKYNNWLPPGNFEIERLTVSSSEFGNNDALLLQSITSLRDMNLNGTRLDDEGMSAFSGLVNLQHLSLIGSKISADGLRHLVPLDRLRALNFCETTVTAEALEHVSKLKGLVLLVLPATIPAASVGRLSDYPNPLHLQVDAPVTDDDAVVISKLRLYGLVLDARHLTDAGLESLRNIQTLESVELRNGEKLTREAVGQFRNWPRLKRLSLEAADADWMLPALGEIHQLEELRLSRIAVTDGNVTQLFGLSSLKLLRICHHSLSDQSIRDLQAALPNCRIDPPPQLAP